MLGLREWRFTGRKPLATLKSFASKRPRVLAMKLTAASQITKVFWSTGSREAMGKFDGVVINAGAYTHTSVAIHDALSFFIGSDYRSSYIRPFQRETFRHISYITPLAREVIKGKGGIGYVMAVEKLHEIFTQS